MTFDLPDITPAGHRVLSVLLGAVAPLGFEDLVKAADTGYQLVGEELARWCACGVIRDCWVDHHRRVVIDPDHPAREWLRHRLAILPQTAQALPSHASFATVPPFPCLPQDGSSVPIAHEPPFPG